MKYALLEKTYVPKTLKRNTVIRLILSPRENGKMQALYNKRRKNTRIIRGFKNEKNR